MSTTRDLAVALQYGACKNGSVLFRIEVPDALGQGADLRWVSAFPSDAEFEAAFAARMSVLMALRVQVAWRAACSSAPGRGFSTWRVAEKPLPFISDPSGALPPPPPPPAEPLLPIAASAFARSASSCASSSS